MIEIAKKMMTKGESVGTSIHADDLPPTQVCIHRPLSLLVVLRL